MNSVTAIIVGALAVILGLGLSIIVLLILGYDPFQIYGEAFGKTFFDFSGLMDTIITWVPIAMCALAVAIAAKVGMWNLGIEGQFYAGAIPATGIALFVNAPMELKLPLMFIAGAVGGGIVAVIIGVLRTKFKISDILSSIMINNILYQLLVFICSQLWKDPSTGAIQTPILDSAATLPKFLPGSRLTISLFVVILIMVVLWFILRYRPIGFEVRAIGLNKRAAMYAGMNVKKCLLYMMFLSGCIAGVAGMMEVSGVAHRLELNIHNNYGFSGFVVAWIARLNIWGIAGVGFLMSGLVVAGFQMQMMGLPSSMVNMLQGVILILCIAGELLTYYKISFKWPFSKKAGEIKNDSESWGTN